MRQEGNIKTISTYRNGTPNVMAAVPCATNSVVNFVLAAILTQRKVSEIWPLVK